MSQCDFLLQLWVRIIEQQVDASDKTALSQSKGSF